MIVYAKYRDLRAKSCLKRKKVRESVFQSFKFFSRFYLITLVTGKLELCCMHIWKGLFVLFKQVYNTLKLAITGAYCQRKSELDMKCLSTFFSVFIPELPLKVSHNYALYIFGNVFLCSLIWYATR